MYTIPSEVYKTAILKDASQNPHLSVYARGIQVNHLAPQLGNEYLENISQVN